MREDEYITATNLAHITGMIETLRWVHVQDPIAEADYKQMMLGLRTWQEALLEKLKVEEEGTGDAQQERDQTVASTGSDAGERP